MLRQLAILLKQPHPIKFLLSRVLPKLGMHPSMDYYGIEILLGKSKLSQSFYAEGVEQRLNDAKFIQDYLTSGDVYADIGANIGTLALLAAKQVGQARLCMAIEAHPRTFCEMISNIQHNDLNVLSVLNAVGDKQAFVDSPMTL